VLYNRKTSNGRLYDSRKDLRETVFPVRRVLNHGKGGRIKGASETAQILVDA